LRIFIVDEHYSQEVLVLGSIIIDEKNANALIKAFIEFKKELFGESREYLPFKWNLSKKNKTQKEALLLLRKRDLTKKDTHSKVIGLVARHTLKIVAVVCEDTRKLRWPGVNPVDFYCWAFKFLLTRFYFILENEGKIKTERGIIIADIHPKRKLIHRDFNTLMLDIFYRPQRFFNRTIPALKEYFLGSFSFGYTEFNCLIQICDCVIGCIGDWIKHIVENDTIPQDHLLREIANKFHNSPEKSSKVKGYGLKVFPPTGKLYSLIPSNLGYL